MQVKPNKKAIFKGTLKTKNKAGQIDDSSFQSEAMTKNDLSFVREEWGRKEIEGKEGEEVALAGKTLQNRVSVSYRELEGF